MIINFVDEKSELDWLRVQNNRWTKLVKQNMKNIKGASTGHLFSSKYFSETVEFCKDRTFIVEV